MDFEMSPECKKHVSEPHEEVLCTERKIQKKKYLKNPSKSKNWNEIH